jgi:hypothetical protein
MTTKLRAPVVDAREIFVVGWGGWAIHRGGAETRRGEGWWESGCGGLKRRPGLKARGHVGWAATFAALGESRAAVSRNRKDGGPTLRPTLLRLPRTPQSRGTSAWGLSGHAPDASLCPRLSSWSPSGLPVRA